MTEHYFSAQPTTSDERHTREVTLAGKTVAVHVATGVFSHGGLDKGTRMLLGAVPAPPPAGTFLDLGCGWGPIAISLALQAPNASVWAVDVNERALDLTAANAAALNLPQIHVARPEDAPNGLTYDLIWSNPPIRIGKAALHELLNTWLPRLAPGGSAWLVVAKNLGADSLQHWLTEAFPNFDVTRPTTSGGFRILRVDRPR
ncbi:MAG: class I SAM-dependent methyltransferase [Nostocoides sp.]